MAQNVKLHVYDLSQGLASQMSLPLLGKRIDGIWHTGVVVYGTEYFFGSMGISQCPPGGTVLGRPHQALDIGVTHIPQDMFEEFLIQQGQNAFQGHRYQLLEHNCNNFSDAVAQFLVGKAIPSHITGLPADVMSTPFGAMIRPLIESMTVQPAGARQGVASPYVAPVPPSTSSQPPTRGDRPFPLATSASSSVSRDPNTPVGATESRHALASGSRNTKPGFYSWKVPLTLFKSDQAPESSARASSQSLSRLQGLERDLSRFVMPPMYDEALLLGSSGVTGDISAHTTECLKSLTVVMTEYKDTWIEVAQRGGLTVDVDRMSSELLTGSPASDPEAVNRIALLMFALTVATNGSSRLPDCARHLFRLIHRMWPTWKSPEHKAVAVEVLFMLAQLSIHGSWQELLTSGVEWDLSSESEGKVSNIQITLSLLVDGLLDANPAVQQLSLRCINNVCLHIESSSAALECAVALIEFLQQPHGELSEVAFLALLRCLAANEDEVTLVLVMTGIPSGTFGAIRGPELQKAVQAVQALLE